MERRKHTALVLALVTYLGTAAAVGWAVPTISSFTTVMVGTAHPTAQEQGQDALAALLDREQVIKSAAGVTSQAYPNADLVQVDDLTICEYRPDGTGTMGSDNYTKVLTEKGRREQQGLSFGFLLPYNKVAVKVVELVKPDGSIVPVDIEKQSKVMIDRSQMSSNIYDPNSKVLQVGVPGVAIGDVVHVVMQQQTMKRYMPDTWDDYQVFESTGPIKHAVYEVHAPKDRPLYHTVLKDQVEGTVKYEKQDRDGQTIHRWEVHDVPRFYAEPGMPPAYTVVQRLLVSTLPDWKAVSSWYWQLCKPHLEATTPEMQAMVGKLTDGITDRQKKIEAIFQWASQQVRYMGITTENESPGWEPHDVKMTFENRHGVCRDKAALLVAMLRLAGFEAYPVLIEAGPKKDAEIPNVAFNHAITCVRNDDGSYQLMDCTDESTKDLLPSYLCDCSYLVAHPAGETLQTSPIVPAEQNMVLVETTGRIDAQGNLTAESDVKFNGINDNAYRGYFARIKPEERRRYFEGVLKSSMATAALAEFELRPADMQDTSANLSVHMKFTAKDILIGHGDTVMMPVPHVGTKVGLVNFIIGQTGLKKRRFPLKTEFACGVREKLSLQVDPAVGSFLSLPQFTPIEDQTILWKQQLEVAQPPSAGTDGGEGVPPSEKQDKAKMASPRAGATIQGQSEFLIKVVELNPQQYLQLKECLKQIEYNERKMPVLARKTGADAPAADVVVLDHQVEYNLTDAHNWIEKHRVVKKIVTYKGKKDNAELKLDYNPVWEEVKLLKATVTNNGQVKEVSKQEINLMDAGWVASAPRYPAAKTLVASLPAVEVGSVIEYEFERVRHGRPFFAATHVFRGFDPIDQETVKLTAPASLALQVLKDDNGVAVPDETTARPVIAETMQREDGKATWQWKVGEQTPLKPEDSLPPMQSFNPVLRVTAGNWQTYSEQVLAALNDASRGQTTAEQRAREIVKQAKSAEEKITAIRDFIVKNIRGAGPGIADLPLTAVTKADQTLADGYGNTTDRAVLMYAMLKAVGFSPEFILVDYGSQVEVLKRFETQYPTAYTFDSVLVRLHDGSAEVYLNDTNQYAELGTTPADGHLALSLAQSKVETVSIPSQKKNLREYEYRLTLTPEGNARITATRKDYGDWFAARHKMFDEMPPEERNRFYQEMVAEISQAAVADSNLVTRFDSYPGVESYSVQVERYAVRDGDYLYFELPRSLGHLFGLRSDTHENPFYQGGDQSLRITTVVELPKGFSNVVLAPGQKEWRLPAGGGTARVRVSKQDPQGDGPTVLTFTHEVTLNPFILEAANYADLLEIEKQLTHAEARTVLVAQKK
jgi:transglutaminase-like putative cysteine protease